MARRKARLFLGNLPENLSEDDIHQRLQKYGTVNSVEIKQKKDIDNKTVATTFAYVNLETEDSTLQQCLHELRSKDWNGSYIKAELAKESFLDRLQREREEASNASSSKTIEQPKDTLKNCSNSIASVSVKEEQYNRKRKILIEDDLEEIGEDEILVSKLESFSDFWKDDPPARLSRQPKKERTLRNSDSLREHPTEPHFSQETFSRSNIGHSADKYARNFDLINVKSQMSVEADSQRKVLVTDKDSAAKVAELKRVQALEEKSKALKQQKDAIKHALSSIDQAKPLNKIIFDDDGDPVKTPPEKTRIDLNKHAKKDDKNRFDMFSRGKQTTKVTGKLTLFDGDDDNDDWQGDFRFKKQFEGKKGKQLLEMQARFKDDERFIIDERFYESDEEKEKIGEASDPATKEEKEFQEEKAKEMEILADVLGEPVQPSVLKKNSFNPMVRFDPLKPSHAKFELPKPNDTKLKSGDIDLKKKPGKGLEENAPGSQRDENESLPVDEKQFYKVASNLKDLFKKENKEVQSTETTTFSLRQMFFSSNEDSEPKEEVEIPKTKLVENTWSKAKPASRPVLRGFQDSKPLAMFTKKLLRPEVNGVTNTFCKDVDVEAIKEKFSEKRRILGRMLHKKKVILERQQHFKQKIGAASLAQKSLDKESAIRRKFVKPWEKKRGRR